MIHRIAQDKIALMASEFPAVLILGPRQCGKTTIAGTVRDGNYAADLLVNYQKETLFA